MALTAVIVAGLLRPAVSDASAPATPREAIAPATPARAPALSQAATAIDVGFDARVADFRARAAKFQRVEAAVAQAFGARPAAGVQVVRPALSRVARGENPQACLAQAVYYEARGEPADGQAAVAQVVLNRARSGAHPADLCGVVFEGASRPGCQFSFACDPRLAGRRPEPVAWRKAEAVASDALSGAGEAPPELAGVLNYHADYVRPRWAAQLARAATIGRHIFYAAAGAAVPAVSGWSFAPAAPASGA